MEKSDVADIDPSRVLNVNLGILGHIDSGKTSLARALSMVTSTASLDKHPQSQERGITLDLGFSAFFTPLPEHLRHLPYDRIQWTLVDCPGHASLIKTVLGGAQIIDMMMLVLDVNKGIQTQTAECLVIAEILMNDLVVVLNKIDTISQEKRDEHISKTVGKLRNVFKRTKFGSDLPIVPVSANPAAVDSTSGSTGPINIQTLMDMLSNLLKEPRRNRTGPFLFAIDHCFPIKGQGTVLTGTVLEGSVRLNQTIEIPSLAISKPVKSMQMFHKPVQQAIQGDRVGICVKNLDSSLLERGLAGDPGSIPTFHAAIAVVNKISYYKAAVKTKAKFHVTLGHTTVMATVIFFGVDATTAGIPTLMSSFSSMLHKGSESTSDTSFDFGIEYSYQDELLPCEPPHPPGSQFALLEFEQPVQVPVHSLIIGSKLDADIHTPSCRIAFAGKILTSINRQSVDDMRRLKIAKLKQREGTVDRIVDDYTLIGKDLFKKETDMNRFIGLKLIRVANGSVGVIESSFGKSGKFKVHFANGGVRPLPQDEGESSSRTGKPKDVLLLNFKKLIFEPDKRLMVQN